MKKWIILLFLLSLTSCTNSYCPKEQAIDVLKDLEMISAEYDDAFNLANNTPRIQLAQPISELQRIKRDTEALAVPECLQSAQENTVLSMERAIEGFMLFMADESEFSIENKFRESDTFLNYAISDIQKIYKCLPNCKPEE